MNKRIDINQVEPEAYKLLIAIESYLHKGLIKPIHLQLIKTRASQLNGCAYCIDMHTKDARKIGETEQRLYALNAWRDTPFFSEEEQAILALTEEVTFIAGHVKDETYDRGLKVLGENYLAQVIMAIIAINAWNRLGISTGMQPSL